MLNQIKLKHNELSNIIYLFYIEVIIFSIMSNSRHYFI